MSDQKNIQIQHDEAGSNNQPNLPPEQNTNKDLQSKNVITDDSVIAKDNDDLFLTDYNTLQTSEKYAKENLSYRY